MLTNHEDDKASASTDKLLKLRRTGDKMMAIKILRSHFEGRKLSYLLVPSSPVYTIRQTVKQQRTSEDGRMDETDEVIVRTSVNMADWLEYHPQFPHQIAFDKDRASLIEALDLAMGTKEFKGCFEVNKQTGWRQLDTLLPYQIWKKC